MSVLLPVYNGSTYLRDAIESILRQTYRNFELIIIDDGSTDGSSFVVEQFDDPRIRFYRQTNQGLAATLNRAIELSKGEYLARQDQDDVSYPQRFDRQIEFLENHPNYGMVGTWATILDACGGSERAHRHPAESLILKFELLFDNPFVHSSIMMRKTAVDFVGSYSTRHLPEDYELWTRIARTFEVANIPEVLQVYREVPGTLSRDKLRPLLDGVIDISAQNIASVVGKNAPDQITLDLSALAHHAYYRVSSNPCMKEIAGLLSDAISNLCGSSVSGRHLLKRRADLRLESIRRSYYCFRYPAKIDRILAAFSRLRGPLLEVVKP